MMKPDPNRSGETPRYFESYTQPSVHRMLLQDEIRTRLFRDAIQEVVQPGQVVIDVGAGSGILSLFAAQAGAEAVHAVDASPLIHALERVAALNDLPAIQTHRGDASQPDTLPDLQADVIVSEWLGHFMMDENMFPAVAIVRDRCLAPGGVMIPAWVELFLAPLSDPQLRHEDLNYWTSRPWGFDLTPLFEEELTRLKGRISTVAPHHLLAEPALLDRFDCRTAPPEPYATDKRIELTLERDGPLDGFCGYFTAGLSPKVVLDTSPFEPATHWRQHVFPISSLETRAGDRLELQVTIRPAESNPRQPVVQLEGTLHGQDGTRSFSYTYDA